MGKNKKQDYNLYELKNGRETVYRGITNDPERREQEHRDDGKRFTSLNTIGRKVTENTAERLEEKSLETYRKNHGGKNPKYNETDR